MLIVCLIEIFCNIRLQEILVEDEALEDIFLPISIPANVDSNREAKTSFTELEVRLPYIVRLP